MVASGCSTGGDMMSGISAGPLGTAPMSDDLDSSVAGEEDPGASIDMAAADAYAAESSATGSPGRSDQPAGQRGDKPSGAARPMSPGDEAPPGTPGTGEDICPRCGG